MQAKTIGIVVVGLLIVAALGVAVSNPEIASQLRGAAAQDSRTYTAGSHALQLEGANSGFLKSVQGGAISADVITEPVGPDYYMQKHIGAPKYEEFAASLGFTSAKPVYEWIKASWANNYQRKSGAVLAADYNYNIKEKREFFNALVTETTIPAMDGSSKEAAYLTVKFAPEYTRIGKASGKVPGESGPKGDTKAFIPANFRLTIDGLDTSRVVKIDSMTVKQTVVQDDIGTGRDYATEPGKLEFPNIRVTISEAGAQSWKNWHNSFVVQGNNAEDDEKTGTLELLAPNRQEVLLTIKFSGLGIFNLVPDTAAANSDQIARVVAEMYVEHMELVLPKA